MHVELRKKFITESLEPLAQMQHGIALAREQRIEVLTGECGNFLGSVREGANGMRGHPSAHARQRGRGVFHGGLDAVLRAKHRVE